jgi:putative FmdB family regulatory protein
MPTYVYECDEGHEIEVVQSIHDEPLTECPDISYRDLEGSAFEERVCSAPCRRVIQSVFFKIDGAGVYKPGFQ